MQLSISTLFHNALKIGIFSLEFLPDPRSAYSTSSWVALPPPSMAPQTQHALTAARLAQICSSSTSLLSDNDTLLIKAWKSFLNHLLFYNLTLIDQFCTNLSEIYLKFSQHLSNYLNLGFVIPSPLSPDLTLGSFPRLSPSRLNALWDAP